MKDLRFNEPDRFPRLQRLIRLSGLLLLSGILLTSPLVAESNLESGETCKARPSFSARTFDTNLVELTVTAPAAGKYDMWISYPASLIAKERSAREEPDSWSEKRLKKQIETPICFSSYTTQTSCSSLQATSDSKTNTLMLKNWGIEDSARIGLRIHRGPVLASGGFLEIRWETDKETYVAEECKFRRKGTALVRVLEKHQLAFDLGTVATLLSEDGNWDIDPEVAMSARSDWTARFLGSVSIRYSAIADQGGSEEPEQTNEQSPETQGMTESPQTTPGTPTDGEKEEPFNPFEDGGGVLELWLDGVYRLPKYSWLGLGGGVGFSSVPGAAESDLELAERWRTGLRFQTIGYNAGRAGDSLADSRGFVMFGLMDDELWDSVTIDNEPSDQSRRWFVEGELELPQIGGKIARALARFWASLPESGDGPGEVRISFLATFDPSNWFPNSK